MKVVRFGFDAVLRPDFQWKWTERYQSTLGFCQVLIPEQLQTF